MAPLVVEQCVDFIRERGLLEVGLFRQPGQATLVKELQDAFDAGEKPSFDSSTDVHTVASLLKLYLRELPEPLVPFSRYQDFLVCGKKISSERKQSLTELRHLLHQLPVANFNLLNYICQFLNEVQSYSSSNKMSTQNLATVFGPNILRPKAEDPESIIGAVVQQLMSELIREHLCLFSRVGGDIEAPGSSRPDSYPSHHPSPCCRQLSLPLIHKRRGSAQNPDETSLATRLSITDHHQQPAEVPHPASQLTESASTVTLQAAPEPSSILPIGWRGPEDPSWAAEQGTTGTSGSSEAQDSTLSDLPPNSPASSSALTDAPLSTGSSEVFLPSAPPDLRVPPASQAMHWLLTGLRQQMARQRAEFEAKIQRLEMRNEALQGEVVGLRSSLEQQRRWYSVAEIKIRNVERARADADRRNTTLQKEMEQFFDTFGELSAEARKSEG
ncbi:unnamed protein product [Oncorhynchus mykiss]|uniref:Rho-GAP domain-containing protein n=1 Tax=Oncorhynchus mykiss TaxID=8022 RepID=A0A060YU86_ONCMY|nr:unnamed protein product [Oncorhynchus mykiss]